MMKYIFVLIVLFVVDPFNGYSQELKLLASYEEHIYSPTTFYVLAEDTILTVELGNKEAVLNLLDLKNNKVINSQRAGMGPGELAQNGMKYITKISKDSIWVWDDGLRRGMLYDQELNYITDIKAEDHAINAALYVNDSTVIAKKPYENHSVVGLYPLDKLRIKSIPYYHIASYVYKSFNPFFRNPLLNQGPMLVGSKETVYIGFDFGSTVLSIDPNGSVDTLSTPYFFPFPKVTSNSGYMAPDHAKSPLTTLSLSGDAESIYLLFSGEKFDDSPFKNLGRVITGKIADAIEESENAKQVFIFDKKSRKVINSFNLPVQSKVIQVYKDFLYTLSYQQGKYVILKFDFIR
ncbi:hypothetical protein [Gracilimonas mengyeensis]|nr:hypothetical protein [Gracilimonas mengyeensis]